MGPVPGGCALLAPVYNLLPLFPVASPRAHLLGYEDERESLGRTRGVAEARSVATGSAFARFAELAGTAKHPHTISPCVKVGGC